MPLKKAGCQGIIVPYDNGREASVVNAMNVYPAKTLSQVVDFLRGLVEIEAVKANLKDLFDTQNRS